VGLRSLASLFEFLGWLGLLVAIALGAFVAGNTADTGTELFGEATETGNNVAMGVFAGATFGFAALWQIAVARAMRLFAEYAAAPAGVDIGPPSRVEGNSGRAADVARADLRPTPGRRSSRQPRGPWRGVVPSSGSVSTPGGPRHWRRSRRAVAATLPVEQ
jgi:hypothetical protein